ncbi:response regulator [Desulfococcaceae bacterium HSG7]|nr:response regulator [Desulfococcaceae bacterium HSG7]
MKDIVLIAEDDPEFLTLLESVFEQHAHKLQVVCVENGEEAINVLKRDAVSLLVTDIQMPKIDGLALLSYVNTNYPGLPCIVMTSFTPDKKMFSLYVRALQSDVRKMLTSETFRFFNKPFKMNELVEAVFEILERDDLGGTIKGISVASFIQMIEMEQKTCQLEIHSLKSLTGLLVFKDGILYNAVHGKLKGEEAAIQIIATDNQTIHINEVEAKLIIDREIKSEAIGLIMEAMRRKDESKNS